MALPFRQSEITVAPNMYLASIAWSVSARQTASAGAAMRTEAWAINSRGMVSDLHRSEGRAARLGAVSDLAYPPAVPVGRQGCRGECQRRIGGGIAPYDFAVGPLHLDHICRRLGQRMPDEGRRARHGGAGRRSDQGDIARLSAHRLAAAAPWSAHQEACTDHQ